MTNAQNYNFEERKLLFVPNAEYKVKKEFSSNFGEVGFVAGESVIFKSSSYSHYDEFFGYEFIGKQDGKRRFWWLADSEPVEKWNNFFTIA